MAARRVIGTNQALCLPSNVLAQCHVGPVKTVTVPPAPEPSIDGQVLARLAAASGRYKAVPRADWIRRFCLLAAAEALRSGAVTRHDRLDVTAMSVS